MSRTWFITGTSSGMGRELTERLLERGDRVAATLRRPDRLSELVTRYPGQLWVRELDVASNAQIVEVVDEAFAAMGRIDVVVSNAGYGVFGAAEELTDDDVTGIIDTNLTGSIRLARAVTPAPAPSGRRADHADVEHGRASVVPRFRSVQLEQVGRRGLL
ncbi:SDR family NAD(P)-dependent oxidoreductase [Kibdelosporangium aridum]|uniref:SDR family NAD(P)-dependent oxidoreductase n=1 Tax=Kibdelosporangium aridum TaxID=2030 RepID=UPI0035F0EB49